MKMLQELFRRVRRSTPAHNFNGCNGYYLSEFRHQMTRIAASLSTPTKAISVSFDREKRHASFQDPDGKVLATLAVHGEMCTSTSAYISPADLSDYARGCFIRELARLRIYFSDVEQRPGYRNAA